MRLIRAELWETLFQTPHETVSMANRDMLLANDLIDFKEGVAGFRAKRFPTFADPI